MSDNPIQGVPVVFPLGTTTATQGAGEYLTHEEMRGLLKRHAGNDWGDLCQEDKDLNAAALKHGDRILSCYTVRGIKYYIITEADRSTTTLMSAEEY